MMPRLTAGVFYDLAIWMAGFGVLIGIIFPFFMVIIGIPPASVLTGAFFAACIAAGLIVGAVNFLVARGVVGSRLRNLTDRMRFVSRTIQASAHTGDWSGCDPETCRVPEDSSDDLGDAAAAFNRLTEALATSHRLETAMKEFSRAIARNLELDALTEHALRCFLQYTHAAGGAVIVDLDGDLVVKAHAGMGNPDALVTSEPVRRALRTLEIGRLEIPEGLMLDGVVAAFRPRHVLIAPLEFRQVPLGIIVLASGETFSPDSESLLTPLRQNLGVALNNALTHERLQRLAALDGLTGCYNRHFGVRRLEEEFARAVRAGTPLGVLMLDIDHFKSVNDTYGHLAGDRVLVRVARTAQRAVRAGDVLVRYGGEEFLALLPGADADDVSQIGERIRRMVSETQISELDQSFSVTVSLGATSYPGDDVPGPIELVRHADEALYRSKQEGRNRLTLARFTE